MRVPEHIEKLQPYEPGRSIEAVREEFHLDTICKLGSNENPLGPSPKALEAVQQCLSQVHYYPDIRAIRLRRALAELFQVKVENCIVGNGSEGIMSAIMGTFLEDKDEVLTASCTFTGFFVMAHARGIKLRTVPLKNHCFDLEAMAEAITRHTKIVFLCNPNNPTGTIFTKAQFEDFMKHVPERVLVILDEAYAEFASDDPDFPDSMRYRLDNCITLRTFSKLHGLAGLRVGYGFAHEDLIRYILKVKLPFEPNVLAQAAALAALNDQAFVEKTLSTVKHGKMFLFESLHKIGLKVLPSHANFVTVVFESESVVNGIFEGLLQKGIIVRPLRNFGLREGLRITIGTQEQNAQLVDALRDAMKIWGQVGFEKTGAHDLESYNP